MENDKGQRLPAFIARAYEQFAQTAFGIKVPPGRPVPAMAWPRNQLTKEECEAYSHFNPTVLYAYLFTTTDAMFCPAWFTVMLQAARLESVPPDGYHHPVYYAFNVLRQPVDFWVKNAQDPAPFYRLPRAVSKDDLAAASSALECIQTGKPVASIYATQHAKYFNAAQCLEFLSNPQ